MTPLPVGESVAFKIASNANQVITTQMLHQRSAFPLLCFCDINQIAEAWKAIASSTSVAKPTTSRAPPHNHTAGREIIFAGLFCEGMYEFYEATVSSEWS